MESIFSLFRGVLKVLLISILMSRFGRDKKDDIHSLIFLIVIFAIL